MNLGERIARLRKMKGLSQDELADLLGVSRGAISMYEINKREPDYETLEKLATFFGVSTDYLLGRTDKPSRKDVPLWLDRDTPPTDIELEEFLETANVHLNGAPLDEEDKEDIIAFLKVKWEREKKRRQQDGGQ